jgi:UDP-N-acetylmuramoyl-tripeptide--D-alanyl-D-alanine ligase
LKFRVYGEGGIDFECRTALLGKHNASNMLAAISVALKLGLTVEEIKRGISKIEPVPHRLQLIKTNNGVTVIDDAYNSNPEGAKQALETIKSFSGGSRIVVTPGLVELGSVEHKENKKLGKVIAECCDYAVLIGIKRSRPLVQGLKEKGFAEDRIIVVTSSNEGMRKLGKIVKAGDVVLFENDLPDNYTEL